jgi:hypothetical protein
MVALVVDCAFVMDRDGAADLDFFVMPTSGETVLATDGVIGRGSVKFFGCPDFPFLFNVTY